MVTWGRARWRGGVVVAVVAVLAVLAAPAGAVTWSAQRPAPISKASRLAAVSCPAARDCVAVGDRGAPSFGTADAQRFNGTRWTAMPAPDWDRPASLKGADITNGAPTTGVSCSGKSRCAAIASVDWSSEGCCGGTVGLVAAWNGRRWSAQAMPTPKPRRVIDLQARIPFSAVDGVACAARGVCVAVGRFSATNLPSVHPVPLVDWLRGGRWSMSTPRPPRGVSAAGIDAAACPAANECVVIGDGRSRPAPRAKPGRAKRGRVEFAAVFRPPLGHRGMARRDWRVSRLPTRAGAGSATLTALSCVRTTACVAIGEIRAHPHTRAIAERFNGRKWTIATMRRLGGWTDVTLRHIACVGARTCQVAGTARPSRCATPAAGGCPPVTVFGTLTGRRLALARVPLAVGLSPGPDIGLAGLDCGARRSCMAVGSARAGVIGTTGTTAHWNGARFKPVAAVHDIRSEAHFNDVACVTRATCIAVGAELTDGDDDGPLIEQRRAGRWTRANLSSLARWQSVELVRCPTATCMAFSTAHQALGELIGPPWAHAASRPPIRPQDMACPTSSHCIAVGGASPGSKTGGAASTQFNGTTWSAATTLSTPADRALACGSPTACLAIGANQHWPPVGSPSYTPVVDAWNGSAWRTVPNPPVPDPVDVACPTATECLVVGDDGPGTSIPVSALFNGSSWSRATPMAATRNATIAAVACRTGASCTAVGALGNGPFSATWNGRAWTRDTTPRVTGNLTAIACQTGGCTAVGDSGLILGAA